MTNNFLTNTDIIKINKRYNERFLVHGNSPKTLGWSDKKQQEYRFKKFSTMTNFSNKSIIDIGCGFGDFYSYLNSQDIILKNYLGVDINETLINTASSLFIDSGKFIVGNILERNVFDKVQSFSPDIAISIGIFNLNFAKDEKKMYIFFSEMIGVMASLAKDNLIIDFIPKNRCDNYPKEDFIMTYDLEFIARVMKNHSLKYTIDCTQDPNPMSEAILIAYL